MALKKGIPGWVIKINDTHYFAGYENGKVKGIEDRLHAKSFTSKWQGNKDFDRIKEIAEAGTTVEWEEI